MARYSLTFTSQTTVARADTTALNTLNFTALQGGNATMQLKVNEVQCGGEATAASAVQIYIFARDTTVIGATVTSAGLTNALMDGSATAPGTIAVFANSTSGTFPQRSATAHLLQHSLNAYGGLVRWQARQGEEITTIGNTQPLGELSYSGFTGTVASSVSGHIIYEVV